MFPAVARIWFRILAAVAGILGWGGLVTPPGVGMVSAVGAGFARTAAGPYGCLVAAESSYSLPAVARILVRILAVVAGVLGGGVL